MIVATVIIGVFRYPHLPAYLSRGGHRVATSPLSAFGVVVGQVYATGLWTALLLLVYRSRPDLDTADPAASLRSYRKALGVFGRAGLVLLACVDLTILLAALQLWQIVRLSGSGDILVLVPFVLGLVAFFCAVVRAGAVRRAPPRGVRRRRIGMTTGSGRPASCTSTGMIPPSWSAQESLSGGPSISATRPRGCSSPGSSRCQPAWWPSGSPPASDGPSETGTRRRESRRDRNH